MAAQFFVRGARPDELATAGRIARDAYLLDGLIQGENDYAAHLEDAAGRAAADGVDVLVAVATEGDDGSEPSTAARAIAGTITVAEAGSALADIALPGEMELRMLGVAHSYRGRGVGELIMREAVALAHRRGMEAVLSLMESNAKAARLYQRMGFERIPERDWRVPEIPELGTMLVYCAPPTVNRAR